MKHRFIFTSVAVAIVAIIAGFWLQSCITVAEPIGEYTPDNVVNELENADTPEEAEVAILNFMESTGLGSLTSGTDPVPGEEQGAYAEYTLSSEQITGLAAIQSSFVTGSSSEFSMETFFNEFQVFAEEFNVVSGNRWQCIVSLEEANDALFLAATEALNNPNDPDNALILSILAEDGNMPDEISLVDDDIVLSPIQGYCYNVWMSDTFGEFIEEKSTLGTNEITPCKVSCLVSRISCGILGGIIAMFDPNYEIPDCEADYVECMNVCHDQGGGK